MIARKNLETRLGVLLSGDPDCISNLPMPDAGHCAPGSQLATCGWQDLGPLPRGAMTRMGPGESITTVEPKPTGGYVGYCKLHLQLIAAGLDVPYESMTGDMSNVNYLASVFGKLNSGGTASSSMVNAGTANRFKRRKQHQTKELLCA
ncbi:hypothetical protein AF72_10655 [Xylella taiwanensis]|uniref:Uncharacterized protein n=1 Tax=Xylella taiwanensis TaxID=1444770 RepID=Z9JHS7_9GAMM|nr:hypothetical protein AF72_10655 [Xylella taiwanensis]